MTNKVEIKNLSEIDQASVRLHLNWMRNEFIHPASLVANLQDLGLVTITINGSVYMKE
jgi:hypothetical protein